MKYIFDKERGEVVPKPEPPSNTIEMLPGPPDGWQETLDLMNNIRAAAFGLGGRSKCTGR